MNIQVFLLVALLAAPAAPKPSTKTAAEKWLNDQSFNSELLHLSSVKTEGDQFICAYGHFPFSSNYQRVLIDAQAQIAWMDLPTPRYSEPVRLLRIDNERELQWSRCEKSGVAG